MSGTIVDRLRFQGLCYRRGNETVGHATGKNLNLDTFLESHGLPATYARTVEQHFAPLARRVDGWASRRNGGAFVLGINGAQGTGKTTLSNLLKELLESDYGRRVAELSIDDLYLTRAERLRLAAAVHPLLATRGVPGTHDVALGISVIERLRALGSGETLALPRFDKATDDRLPASDWPVAEGPVDVIVFEGWCVCSAPSPAAALAEPINELEATEDADGRWRRFVNSRLESAYRPLFAEVDALVFLQAPDFASIRRWRMEQEQKLIRSAAGSAHTMDEAGVERFVQYFERISRHDLVSMPAKADVVIQLSGDHEIESSCYRDGT